MSQVGTLYEFTPSTTIESSKVDANFAALKAAINTALLSDTTVTATVFQRMANAVWWKGRNQANNADINAWRINASDLLELGVAPVPPSNDGAALGASGTAWSDLFLASGAVINFAAGNVTLTHSSGYLTASGGIAATAQLRIINSLAPATAAGVGSEGDIAHDTDYIYICTATNTWKRVAVATWP